MADFATVETMLSGIVNNPRSGAVDAQDLKRIQKAIFQYLLKDIRLGRAEDGDPSKNFGGGFFTATTPAVANTEFTIAHTFGRPPYLLIPVLPLDQIGAKIVPLEVSRAADAIRIYLKSSVTSAEIFLYLEG